MSNQTKTAKKKVFASLVLNNEYFDQIIPDFFVRFQNLKPQQLDSPDLDSCKDKQ